MRRTRLAVGKTSIRMPVSEGNGGVPRVTVLTTVYNGARYLEETIESVLAQSWADFEYIVVDDGSTDSTPALLEKWAARDPRLVVIRNETNRGIPASANRGLAAARGEYVARLDADDVSEPDRLRIQVEVLDSRPDVAMVSMNYYLMRQDGLLLRKTNHHAPPEVIEYLLHFGNAVGGHSQVMYRRSAVMQVGGYDEACPVALDYDLWTRLVRVGRIVILPSVGMRYRIHSESISVRSGTRQRAVAASITRRMLTGYLGREISDRELEALSSLWSRVPPSPNWRLADSILREGFAIFIREQGRDPALRRRVRQENARRFVAMGIALAWKGRIRQAWWHFLAGARWETFESVRTFLRLLRNAFHDQWLKYRPLQRKK